MAKISEIIDILNKIAPLSTQEYWDNSGWQIRLQKKDIKKVMLCVSVTEDVLKQTVDKNCDMIVAHHPLFFGDFDKPLAREIIRNYIPVYSIHTPLDIATKGTTDSLILACGLNINYKLNNYTKISDCDMTLDKLVQNIKRGLKIDKLRVTNYKPDKVIKKIAFCAGSGTSFCDEVKDCDCFVTADLKYHTALDFEKTIIDVGHLESERPVLENLKELLNNVECEIAEEHSPIEIL